MESDGCLRPSSYLSSSKLGDIVSRQSHLEFSLTRLKRDSPLEQLELVKVSDSTANHHRGAQSRADVRKIQSVRYDIFVICHAVNDADVAANIRCQQHCTKACVLHSAVTSKHSTNLYTLC